MVVNYFDDTNCGDIGLVKAPRQQFWAGVVVGFEDEAGGAPKVEGVLTGPVCSERV